MQQVQQAQKSFLPGASSLIEQLDTKVLVILRDGRHLLGTLRSLDQFSNLVLEDTYERHICGNKYADIYLGLYIVRGDSLVLLGEAGEDDAAMTEVEMSEIQELRSKQKKEDKSRFLFKLFLFDPWQHYCDLIRTNFIFIHPLFSFNYYCNFIP